MKKYFLFIILFLLFVTTGCKEKIEISLDVKDKILLSSEGEKTIHASIKGNKGLVWNCSFYTYEKPFELELTSDTRKAKIVGLNEGTGKITVFVEGYPKINKEILVYVDDDPKVEVLGSTRLEINEEETFTAITEPEFLKDDIVWATSDASVASVDKKGVVKALKPGNVIIYAISKSTNVTGQINIKVPGIYQVDILGKEELAVGEDCTYSSVIYNLDSKQDVVWSVSDPDLAIINQEGLLRAIKPGVFKVYAKSIENEKVIGALEVKTIVKPTRIEITHVDKMNRGETINLDYLVYPNEASSDVLITSSDGAIINVSSDNTLYANNVGSATITVTSLVDNRVIASKNIQVVIYQNLIINGDDGLTVNSSKQYSISNAQYLWSSSDESIATVDSRTGVVTGKKVGEVTILASLQSNPDIYGTKIIKIYDKPTELTYSGITNLVPGGSTKVLINEINSRGNLIDPLAIEVTSSNKDVVSCQLYPRNSGYYLLANEIGKATITIKSKVTNLTTTQEIIVDDFKEQTNSILVYSLKANRPITYKGKTYVGGYNGFTYLKDALEKAKDNCTIYIVGGSFDNVVIKNNGITLIGDNATISGVIYVNKDIKDLTITNLTFKEEGRIHFSEQGGIENFTFKNNIVHSSEIDPFYPFIYFANYNHNVNKNFHIVNNQFLVNKNNPKNTVKFIKGEDAENITITGNTFEGVRGSYVDAIKIEGDSRGVGASGVIRINNNYFYNIGQRGIWITKYSASLIDIKNNVFDWAGDINYGGPIQLDKWANVGEIVINIKYNTFKNINAWYAIRFVNDAVYNSAPWEVHINYNKFVEFIDPVDGVCDFVLSNSISAAGLLNAENNYFDSPIENRFVNVGAYSKQFKTVEELYDSIIK